MVQVLTAFDQSLPIRIGSIVIGAAILVGIVSATIAAVIIAKQV
jgi:hypothetical protein